MKNLARMPVANLDLVVLSACTSAASTTQISDGNFAVDQLLVEAGIGSALGMLWPVKDRATAELMKLFYVNLRCGNDKDVALALAQRSMLSGASGAGFLGPENWAAPVVSGNWLGWRT